jgi:hypothetical protein
MTSSLQIRATNAATQCEQSCFTRRCGVYAFCSRLISAHTHTHLHYTLCSHHRNANILHSFSLVRTWARLRTILSRGTCLFLHTGPSKSQLKTPTLTKVGPKPYVSYTISPHFPYHPTSSPRHSCPPYLKPHHRFKFNRATISAAYHLPSLPCPMPTREYQI